VKALPVVGTRPVVLYGVFSDPWVLALDPKIRDQASHEVIVPLRVF